jgi:hypothetical protein
MGRIIGDGGCFYQMDYLDKNAPATANASLIADFPADELYKQFGFEYTAPISVGMYKRY